jgi:hypothetical protein
VNNKNFTAKAGGKKMVEKKKACCEEGDKEIKVANKVGYLGELYNATVIKYCPWCGKKIELIIKE